MSFTLQDYQKIEAEEWPQAQRLAEYIKSKYQPMSVYDIGCGTGLYLRPLALSGIDVMGWDCNTEAIDKSMIPYVRNFNITMTKAERKRELSICLEVLEHIPKEFAETAIENLTTTSDTIIFSAAQPGQEGIGHVNCQSREYWLLLFRNHGFYKDVNETCRLIEHMKQGYHMGWLVNNVMVVKKKNCSGYTGSGDWGIDEGCGTSGVSGREPYRFHLLGLAHIPTSPEYFSCAYSQKIVKLAKMLKELGHTVFFYGTEGSQVECDRFFTVGTQAERRECYGDYNWKKDFFKHDPKDKVHQNFNARAIAEINQHKQERDFLLITMGNYQLPISQAVNLRMTVESGIGYSGVFAPFKVFESYAWMHYLYGMMNQGDGSWYDAVIPNYYDPADFHTGRKSDYYLFVGRLISRKGLSVACEVTQRLGKKLIVAGQGTLSDVDRMDLSKYEHVAHIGSIDPKQRAELMAGAIAVFTPTYYIGPYEGVHVESMMCGTPCLTTDWGVFTETVVQGVNGFRCRTFAEFVDAAKKCSELDPQVIRDYAVANFSMDKAAQLYEHYFDALYDIWDRGWYQDRTADLSYLTRQLPAQIPLCNDVVT